MNELGQLAAESFVVAAVVYDNVERDTCVEVTLRLCIVDACKYTGRHCLLFNQFRTNLEKVLTLIINPLWTH